MTENFQTIIDVLEKDVHGKEAYLNTFLESGANIDEMDYDKLLEWVDNVIENDYRNKFICEWKDYAFIRGKLETAKQLKELVEKAIDEFWDIIDGINNTNHVLKETIWRKIEELRKSLGVEE